MPIVWCRRWIAFGSATVTLLISAVAQEPELDPSVLARVPPTEPAQALSTFQVKPGFRLELVASEPLIADPVAMAFDEKGRLYVVEMRGYSERRQENLGRIKLLEDTDQDGQYDRATIFATDLAWPTALTCYNGGIFVGATPDILYLRDANNDGVADEQDVAFTGFGALAKRLNVQALLNNFTWGLDGRIHGALGGNPSRITGGKLTEPVVLRGLDFSFEPEELFFRPETGGGQFGLAFDSVGRKFVCSNSHHIQRVMYPYRYTAQSSQMIMPNPLVDIPEDGAAAEVFRISPDEPWRVVRTRWRVAGQVPGPIEGGGRASGYFTAATGLTIYRGDAFPEEYRGDAFIADAGSNLIHHKDLLRDGLEIRAVRPPDEQRTEFLASKDNWFRPVQLLNGPDGALYVIDMYREIIEHPWSLPPALKKHLDLNSGNDRGRIYRIVPSDFKQPKNHVLGTAPSAELVTLLGDPNGWKRDTAARLLLERGGRDSLPLLERAVKESNPFGRLHAISLLGAMEEASAPVLAMALRDSDAAVRKQAVIIAEASLAANAGAPFSDDARLLQDALAQCASDPDIEVRYQLALTLSLIDHPEEVRLLSTIMERASGNRWIESAVLNALQGSNALEFLIEAATTENAHHQPDLKILRQLSELVAARSDRSTLRRAIEALGNDGDRNTVVVIVSGLLEGLKNNEKLSPKELQLPQSLVMDARTLAQDLTVPEPFRMDALRLLAAVDPKPTAKMVLSNLEPHTSVEMQKAMVTIALHWPEDSLRKAVLDRWDSLGPVVRDEFVQGLLVRSETADFLLDAIEAEALGTGDLRADQVRFLREHPNKKIHQRAERVLGRPVTGPRQEAVGKFAAAVGTSANLERGKRIFIERCATCHRHHGLGTAVGPELAAVLANGPEKLLASIIDPNQEVAPAYTAYQIETKEDEAYSGIVARETDLAVVLKLATGQEIAIPRNQIAKMSAQRSLMPEGLEEGLTVQAMADLLGFILMPAESAAQPASDER